MAGEQIVFWASVSLLIYVHAGYPLLLWVWVRIRPHATHTAAFEPSVSVLVVAYNEAARVNTRIDNLLAQDYPHGRLQIIIASDGSEDDTVLRARENPATNVEVIAFTKRRGKSAVLNDVIPMCGGDIVVLADARQRFDPGALGVLAAHFADPEVGAVGGELLLTSGDGADGVGEGVGLYWKYEKFIRHAESRIDSTIGASGAIYAIRRKLFEPVPVDTVLDDVLIPVNVVRQGYRVLFEPRARAYDRVTTTAQVEFMRKVRTLAGNFQLFVHEPWLLNPFANRLWIQTVSHKGLRLLVPVALVFAFNTNLLLLHIPIYRWIFVAQVALYAAAIAGFWMRNSRQRIRVLKIPYVFCMLNWAVVVGFVRFMYGRQQVTWETAPREPVAGDRQSNVNPLAPNRPLIQTLQRKNGTRPVTVKVISPRDVPEISRRPASGIKFP